MSEQDLKDYPVLVCVFNHFDQTWRRCWDRPIRRDADSLASYADIEGYWLDDALEMAACYPEYKFQVESTIIVRHYVERHPERLAELRRLAEEGRFTVLGAGENIVDSNMVLGESLVRNFLLGLTWIEENLGIVPIMGTRNDAFGNSAQLPQIFRGCGLDWVTWLIYHLPRGEYWRGLDGSTVCCANLPRLAWGAPPSGPTYAKYAPCPACRGGGCPVCFGRGIETRRGILFPATLDEEALRRAGAGFVYIAAEELLPDRDLIRSVAEQAGRYNVRFALEEEARPFLADKLARVDDPPADKLHPGPELNPCNTGVLVSRIEGKQQCRRQEYALLAAEALGVLAGTGKKQETDRLWRLLLLTMFHDAVTGTHVDAANEELRHIWRQIDAGTGAVRTAALAALTRTEEGTFTVLNPSGFSTGQIVSLALNDGNVVPALEDGTPLTVFSTREAEGGSTEISFLVRDLPPLSGRSYRLLPAAAPLPELRSLARPAIENERFRIEADEKGITGIFDKALQREIAAGGRYRPNELVLERDEGSPWATLHPDRSRLGLAEMTRLVEASAGPGWQKLVFQAEAPRMSAACNDVALCACRSTVTLYEGLERVDFLTEVEWDTFNSRLRLAMPLTFAGKGIYGIPYGHLERRPYEPNFYDWTASGGDWPAVNWAGAETDGLSVALLNRGLPSYCLEDEAGRSRIMLSLLRSPAVPTYLHEAGGGTDSDWDGMRDVGCHRFQYALTAYGSAFAGSGVIAEAEGYNGGLLAVPGRVELPDVPRLSSQCGVISALKRPERGDGLVLRIWEYRGQGGRAELRLPSGFVSAARVNLLEKEARLMEVSEGRVTLELRPWEIATLLLEG